ncbi:glycosyl transferase [Bifidobacterium aemilianum]|uniref:Glycosyl transferase n=1 Tax=Bifidobacterium aemilianum TaxID=2493120 RepID=A0A366K828_9BIFI|nr:glycosyltransferase family 2 protein [Bifidobacterium aemilianum]RBP97886.1 glycosyl transferase [Bifidobacterium aemilianum]
MQADTSKTLTFVVPAFNMELYLGRCVNSLVAARRTDDIEVIIVDDGSSDGTADLADSLQRRLPGVVRVIHQTNKGHGGAVNAGVAEARGTYIKVVDADDWVGSDSLERVLKVMRRQVSGPSPVDLLVTDYVYDKVGKHRKHVVRFANVMKPNRVLGWDDLRHFGIAQYMIMHTLIFRTDVLRESKLELPEHTFYVDFIYSYQPFPWVKTLMYLDTPLYHYFIGRDGQSVQTDVMIRRVNQLRKVNRLMAEATPERGTVPQGLYRYMIHFLSINSVVTSVFLILSRDPKNYQAKAELWKSMDRMSPQIARDVRRKLPSRAINLHGPIGRAIIRWGYGVAERFIGFN